MKVLIYADLHIHNHYKQAINSETALNFLTYINEYCLENNIKNIFFAGDFFHTKSRAYAPHVIQSYLRIKDIAKNNVSQYMLVGNHDMANNLNSMNSIMFVFSDYAEVVPDYKFFDIENIRFHFLSYTTSILDNVFILSKNKKNILITHLDINGFEVIDGFSEAKGYPQEIFSKFDLVFSGHFHKPQEKNNIIYIGTPYQTSFVEKERDLGFIVFDTDTLKYKRIIYNEAPKYKILEIDSINDIEESCVNNNFLKIKLKSNNINKAELRERIYEYKALSVDIIPYENSMTIEKYSNNFSDEPIEIAKEYLKSLESVDLDFDILINKFKKIEEVSQKITEYEI